MPNLSGNTKPNSLSWHSACSEIFRKVAKVLAVGLLALAVSTPVFVGSPSKASGETRSLKIYFVHTGEKAVITYKRDGKFDPAGLEKLNRILRDWRKNQPTKMNPHLFDLIWQVYRESGSHEFINVVCGFRSPGTNEMLRTRSAHTGVAKKSQHMLGNAMDFYIPDVKLTKLREIGMKLQVGGVGYYPTSGSPFVHMDVGGVRAWPRMDRQELVRLFPDGKTMHIPADGRPLPGYQQAVADYKRRMSSDDIQIASSSPSRRGFFARLFGGGGADEEEDNADTGAPAAAAPTTLVAKNTQRAPVATDDGDDSQPVTQQVASVNAPVPQVRPAFGNQAGSEVASALMSPPRNAAQDALAAAMPTADAQQQQYADLRDYRVPVPALLNRRTPGDAEMASAESDVTNQAIGVPVPVERPEIAENLLASADADPDAIDDAADQGTLSPAIVAALEQRRADQSDANAGVAVNTVANNVASKDEVPPANSVAADNDAVRAIAAVLPQKRPVQQMPMQVAALAPTASESKASSRRFNDSFEVMAPQERPIAAGIATKGGRPNKRDAVVADSGRAAVTTPPKLTDKMISQWAIANARVEIVNRPVKAPRFVSPTLRAQPTAVYTEGFKVQTASMDPERFSGTAVNFLQVKKFNSVE
ncbi:DUF882 domain-containing protein [Agrobacterium sp. SHOUNA12C]|uniref:DUF882 domain-containing protein n=1 Tax=Rhizobium rhizogenes TaxID=359 RepID=UPI0004D9F3D7|nr:DUF882 domain-containing protein [Rhizobium rhizogenes]KAA6484503.1 DUF882 domain-containing protein [Agrobacterium sp. ICMP 7243]MCJ9724635.1 DUF882 domain-containing protein [Agrobacterium sp. BETTINA12B]MCJ9760605.1 DUF882 domain-containing protein [Agrobacterium sp. SHOUNA12C]OCI92174.1 ATP/GTP-binding protein [Agrobacterium sp. 13-626]OCJ13730.1 ATP/GTP-binding protein [Agrobacterium sp. B131/95]OCJ16768.1 ATP/GTP-binding protein [Agrobacterium sp. B133/95]